MAMSAPTNSTRVFVIESRLQFVCTLCLPCREKSVVRSANVLIEPGHEELGDAGAVFFGHHLMAVARQSHVFQSHIRSLDARLVEPLGYAMGIGTVITGLAGNFQDRDALQIYKFVRWLLLK